MEKKTVFITAFALSKGIIEIEADIEVNDKGEYRAYALVNKNLYGLKQKFEDNEFYFNRDNAVEDAIWRRLQKIRSLRNQITKLENLKF